MSGLEDLRKFAGGYPITSITHNALMDISNEIERDMKENSFYVSFEMFAKSIGKPIEESPVLNIREWLNRWYLPRPVIDGEPVQFGERLVNNIGQEIVATNMFFYSDSDKSSICVNGRNVNEWERIEPDSIEKLRDEIYDVVSDVYAIGANEIVDEWLSRAEKLFKDGCE